jgi:hypothetical protein
MFRGQERASGKGDIVRRTQDAHTAPGVKHKQIVIATDDGPGSSRESQLPILVVLWFSAIGYVHRRLEPDSRPS